MERSGGGERKYINLKDKDKERTKINFLGQENFEQFVV